MKTKSFLLLLIAFFFAQSSQAQFINFYITGVSQNACGLNQSVEIVSQYCNFNLGSNITGTIDWGDGNVVPIASYMTVVNPPQCDSNGQTVSHTYLTQGTYTVTVTQTGPGAPPSTQTMTINNQGQCIDFSGYVYTDANNNCLYDVGEVVSPNQYIILNTPNSAQYYIPTNANGFYQISGILFTPGTYTLTPATPGGIVCPAAQSYSITTATATNLNFGYSNAASLGSMNLTNTNGGGCNNNVNFSGILNVCNLPNGTPITYNINYGDGNTSNVTVNYTSGPNACDSVNLQAIIPPHTYASPGTYTVTVSATAMGTLVSNGSTVVTALTCISVSGYLFADANTNCIFDATEQPFAFTSLNLTTSNAVYVTSSDQFGFYSFNVPQGIGTYSVTPNVPFGSSLSCPAQSPFISNAVTQTNVNFGYNPGAPNIVATLYDSVSCNSLQYQANLNFNACGFAANSTFLVTIDFGDGNSATPTTTMFPMGGGCTSHYANIAHTYATYGVYYLTTTITSGAVTTTIYDTVTIAPCGNVSGYTYNDLNSNCVFDPGEQVSYQTIQIKLGNTVLATTYSDMNGYYTMQFPFITGNNYVVESNPIGSLQLCYSVSCPAALNYLVTTQNSTNLNFGFVQNNTNYDNAVTGVLAWCCGVLQAGANRTFKVSYHNYLCGSNNGTVSVTIPSNFTFISSPVTPLSVAGNVITWSFSNLTNQNWNNDISFVAYVPFLNASNVPYVTGDPVCLSASIASTSPGTDQNLSNNTYNTCFYIGTSYDPNDKHPFPKGTGNAGNIAPGTELEYVIRFQNTGQFPAQQVYILDTLESDLDVNTLQVLGSSHHMLFTQNGAALRFDFPNIMLPDSTSDPEGSMGFVRFKIKPKANAALGTIINNQAGIYFDFNAPVITNTTINTIANPSSVTEKYLDGNIMVYPNPSKDNITIRTENIDLLESATIYNTMGERVKHIELEKSNSTITIKELPTGVYLIRIKSKEGLLYTTHFTKE